MDHCTGSFPAAACECVVEGNSEWTDLGIFGVVESSASQFEVALFPPLEGACLFQQQSLLYTGLQEEKTRKKINNSSMKPSIRKQRAASHSHMQNTLLFLSAGNCRDKKSAYCLCVCLCVSCNFTLGRQEMGQKSREERSPLQTRTALHFSEEF